jgi:bacterioferritin-associated ferredoxin
MYVCLCMGITDRDVQEVIGRGARTAREILRQCGPGRPCGGCSPTLRHLLRQTYPDVRREMDDVVRMDRYREAR